MALHFDVDGLINELLDKLQNELKWAFKAWENEVYNHTGEIATSRGEIKGEVDNELTKQAGKIIAYLKANTYILADAYGTGSLMLDDNPGLDDYKRSNKWNPERTGKAIVGRKAGDYEGLFGKAHSSGTMKGENIEYLQVGTGYQIKPIKPSKSIQIANQWLYNTYLPRAYENAVKAVNFAKFLKEK